MILFSLILAFQVLSLFHKLCIPHLSFSFTFTDVLRQVHCFVQQTHIITELWQQKKSPGQWLCSQFHLNRIALQICLTQHLTGEVKCIHTKPNTHNPKNPQACQNYSLQMLYGNLFYKQISAIQVEGSIFFPGEHAKQAAE